MTHTEPIHPVGLPEWLLARVDATVTDEANYIGCICVDEHRRVALVEPTGHFLGVRATFPKVARAAGERPSEALVRCVTEKLGARLHHLYPVPGVWAGDRSRTVFFAAQRAPWGPGGPSPTSPHVAAVHDCTFEAALARLGASPNDADRLRDLALLPLVRAMALSPARRLMLMVRVLHRMGFERLRPCCGLSPSGVHWRFELTTEARAERPRSWTDGTLGARSRDALDVDYSTAMGQRVFGLVETCFESPEDLAARLLRDAPSIPYAGLGRAQAYARWYDDMLARTEPEGVVIDDLDGDLPIDATLLANPPDASVHVALPPSTARPYEPVQVALSGREDGVWFGRLADARLRDAARWFVWIDARDGSRLAFDEIPLHLKVASWSTLAEAVARAQYAPARSRPPDPLARRGRGAWYELARDDDWRAVTDEGTVALYLPPPWTSERVQVELWALCDRVDSRAPVVDELAERDRRIDAKIEEIDARLGAQTDAILHHPEFQRLEASWRALEFVVGRVGPRARVRVELWNCSKTDLEDDFADALDLGRSALYHQLWTLNYGDGPYGLVVGGYEFDHGPADVALLERVAAACADAGTPFLADAAPRMFGAATWDELARHADVIAVLDDFAHLRWNAFRARPEARFVGLCLPRFALRAPHRRGFTWPRPAFETDEDIGGDPARIVWGSAAALLATRVARSFASCGWCANLLDHEDGAAADLPTYETERDGEVWRLSPIEGGLSDTQARALNAAGFIVLTRRRGTSHVSLAAAPSCHAPAPEAPAGEARALTLGRRLSAELPYLFIALPFVHAARAMQRERVGLWRSPDEVMRGVAAWLDERCVVGTSRADSARGPRPLARARIELAATQPEGSYRFRATLYATPRKMVGGEPFTLPVPVVFPAFW
jgi:type VI secretion system protein ImpC